MSLARQNLFQNKVRLLLSAAGVALSVMLILILNGFLSGVYKQATAYLENSPGSVVVVQGGIRNFFAASSVLPPGTVNSVRETRGISEALGIASQFVIFELHDEKQGAQVVGYDPKSGGGPWELSKGRGVRADDEVVVDRALAKTHGISVGDELSIGERDFTVVGISEGTSMWAAGLMFVRKDAAQQLIGAPEATSLLLVTPKAGVTPTALRERLDDLPGTDALLKSTMANNDEELFAQAFGGPLRLMVGISLLVGALVVGLVIYTATVERQKEYGVLKAVGARNRTLYRVVVSQALITAGLGSALGKTQPGQSPEEVAKRIEEDVGGVTAQSRQEFAEQERRLVNDMAGDLLTIMNLAGFMTGLAVVALTVYTATLARRAEYGVLKALGARNARLYGVVLVQALYSVALGFAVGLAFTLVLSAIVPVLGSNLPLQVGAASLLKVGSASLVIAALAAVLPIRQIAGLDPAAVFRG